MTTLLLTAEALRRSQALYAHAGDNAEKAEAFTNICVTQRYWPQLLSVQSGDCARIDVSDQDEIAIQHIARGFDALGFNVMRESEAATHRPQTFLNVSWGMLSAVAGAAREGTTPQLNLNTVDVTSVTQFRDSLLDMSRNTRHLFDWDIPALHFQSTRGDELVPILRELAAGRAPALTVDTAGLHINGPEDAAVLMILPDLLRNEGCTVAVEGTRLHITYPVKACR